MQLQMKFCLNCCSYYNLKKMNQQSLDFDELIKFK